MNKTERDRVYAVALLAGIGLLYFLVYLGMLAGLPTVPPGGAGAFILIDISLALVGVVLLVHRIVAGYIVAALTALLTILIPVMVFGGSLGPPPERPTVGPIFLLFLAVILLVTAIHGFVGTKREAS